MNKITNLTLQELRQFLEALHKVAKNRDGITWNKLMAEGVPESSLKQLMRERYINLPQYDGRHEYDIPIFVPWTVNKLWTPCTIKALEDYVKINSLPTEDRLIELEARVSKLEELLQKTV